MGQAKKVIVALVPSYEDGGVTPSGAEARIERYKRADDSRLSRNAYAALSRCLEFVGISPERCTLTGDGKPYILFGDTRLEFNNSHSGNLSISAFGGTLAVGADIERIDASAEAQITRKKIAKRFFSDAEFRLLSESDSFAEKFTEIWTRHESLGKLIGDGFFFGDTEDYAKANGIEFLSARGNFDDGYVITLCAAERFEVIFLETLSEGSFPPPLQELP